MTSKKAQEMERALHDALMDADPGTLLQIYDEINAWDGTFIERSIEIYTIDEIEDLGMLRNFINDLKYHRSDDNPLQYDYFTIDSCGEWTVWDDKELYNCIDELVDYLINEAEYPGFPVWAMKRVTIVFEGYEIVDIERFCKFIQKYI